MTWINIAFELFPRASNLPFSTFQAGDLLLSEPLLIGTVSEKRDHSITLLTGGAQCLANFREKGLRLSMNSQPSMLLTRAASVSSIAYKLKLHALAERRATSVGIRHLSDAFGQSGRSVCGSGSIHAKRLNEFEDATCAEACRLRGFELVGPLYTKIAQDLLVFGKPCGAGKFQNLLLEFLEFRNHLSRFAHALPHRQHAFRNGAIFGLKSRPGLRFGDRLFHSCR